MIEVEIEVGEGSEKKIPADEVLAEETQADGKCTTLHVPSAVKIVKSRFVQIVIGRYIAVTVLRKGETKMVDLGVQATETSAGQILTKDGQTHQIVVIEEIQVVGIVDN